MSRLLSEPAFCFRRRLSVKGSTFGLPLGEGGSRSETDEGRRKQSVHRESPAKTDCGSPSSVSCADSSFSKELISPPMAAERERIVPQALPLVAHQCAHWFAMTKSRHCAFTERLQQIFTAARGGLDVPAGCSAFTGSFRRKRTAGQSLRLG